MTLRMKSLEARHYLTNASDCYTTGQYTECVRLMTPLFTPSIKGFDGDQLEVLKLAKNFIDHEDHFQKRVELRKVFIEVRFL